MMIFHNLTILYFSDNSIIKYGVIMIRKLPSGKYRLYSRSKDPKTHKRRNLGTFDTRKEAVQHEKEIHFFKGHR